MNWLPLHKYNIPAVYLQSEKAAIQFRQLERQIGQGNKMSVQQLWKLQLSIKQRIVQIDEFYAQNCFDDRVKRLQYSRMILSDLARVEISLDSMRSIMQSTYVVKNQQKDKKESEFGVFTQKDPSNKNKLGLARPKVSQSASIRPKSSRIGEWILPKAEQHSTHLETKQKSPISGKKNSSFQNTPKTTKKSQTYKQQGQTSNKLQNLLNSIHKSRQQYNDFMEVKKKLF